MSDAQTDVQADVDALRDVFSDIRTLMQNAGGDLFQTAPAISDWSPAQHLYHILGTNAMMLKASALLAHGAVDGEPAGLSDAGANVLSSGIIERGVATAPEKTVPPDSISREDLEASFARSYGKFESAAEALRDGAPEDRGLPHPMWGVLTSRQWLKAARVHCRHHLAIIDDIRAELSA